jgi:hypothetical protein
MLATPLARAQTMDTVSREVSLFNFDQPTANCEAVSREVSLFDFSQPTAHCEAVSREISVFDFSSPTATHEAISRELSLFDFNQPTARCEAVSREVSVFAFDQAVARIEAVSREVSLFDRGSNTLDVVGREVSVFFFGPPATGVEGISREVSLYDYGYNRLNLTVGATVVPAGTAGAVPVTLSTFAPVTNVLVAVDFPQTLLTNWSLQVPSPLTGAAVVSNGSRLYLTFSPASGQSLVNTQQLGWLCFTSASNQPSAFLPLPVAGLSAPMANGESATPWATTRNGEVVVLNGRPLLRQVAVTNGQEYLELYGYPGTNYTIESATNLVPPVDWRPVWALTPSDFTAATPELTTTNPALFFRASQ